MRMVVRIDRDDLTADGETAAVFAEGDAAFLRGLARAHAGRGNGWLFLELVESIFRRALDKVEADHIAVFQLIAVERESIAIVANRLFPVDGEHPAGPVAVYLLGVGIAERDIVRVCDALQIAFAAVIVIGIAIAGQRGGHSVQRSLARIAHGFIACAGGIDKAVLRGERAVDADGDLDRRGRGGRIRRALLALDGDGHADGLLVELCKTGIGSIVLELFIVFAVDRVCQEAVDLDLAVIFRLGHKQTLMRDHSIVARTERSVRNAGLVDIRGIVQIVHFYVLICVIIRGIHKAISVAIRNDFLKGLEFYRHIVLVGVSAFDARPVDIGGADLFHKRRSRVDLALLHGQDGQFDALLGQKGELIEVRRRCALGAQTDLRGQRHLLRRVAGQRAIDRRARTVDGDDRGIAAEEADRRFGVIKILILLTEAAQILADKARVRQEHIARNRILRNGFARGCVPQRVLRGQRGVQQRIIVHRRGLRGLDRDCKLFGSTDGSHAVDRDRTGQLDGLFRLRQGHGDGIGGVAAADLADADAPRTIFLIGTPRQRGPGDELRIAAVIDRRGIDARLRRVLEQLGQILRLFHHTGDLDTIHDRGQVFLEFDRIQPDLELGGGRHAGHAVQRQNNRRPYIGCIAHIQRGFHVILILDLAVGADPGVVHADSFLHGERNVRVTALVGEHFL